jgi:DNA helicase IV
LKSVNGRAGSGKTTVVLYRVAWLTFACEETAEPPVDPANVLIVMLYWFSVNEPVVFA